MSSTKPSSEQDVVNGPVGEDAAESVAGYSAAPELVSEPEHLSRNVEREEQLWVNLERSRLKPDSLEKRAEMAQIYEDLASHYASLGGGAQALRFVRNAVAQRDSPSLRRHIAQLEGFEGGLEFIKSYSDLLRGQPYNLGLVLEFCFF